MMVKSAGGKPATTHSLSGELYKSKSGWLLLRVPNALVRGAFAALDEPGVELPPSGPDNGLNAHISVIRPEELEAAGLDPDDIKERGQHFKYTLGPVQTVTPNGWAEMSKVWFIKVQSPDLKQLRRTYGLTPLPKNNEFDFHISIAVRRKNVLGSNSVRKAASLIHGGNISEYFSRSGDGLRGREAGLRSEGREQAVHGGQWQHPAGRQGGGEAVKLAGAQDDPPTGAATPQAGEDDSVLATLHRVKQRSDVKDYGTKYMLLRQMMRQHPEAFIVDTPEGKYHGITHQPTGFQFHVPQTVYDDLIKTAALGYAVRDSDIHGQGTFATRAYEPGERIGLALQFNREHEDGTKEYDRTVLGRFVNYQPEGNVVLQEEDGQLYLHASKPIAEDEEMYTQPYDDELAAFQPMIINGGYKQAFDLSGSWYGGAAQDYANNLLAGRGQLWNPNESIMANVGRHFGSVRDMASNRIRQAENFGRFQSAMDPNYSMRQLSSYLSGKRQPLIKHPVDAILHGRFGS